MFIFLMVISGIILLWFGYLLLFGALSPRNKKKRLKEKPDGPKVCPVCSMKMLKGDLVKTEAFPAVPGSSDRLMYIKGCVNCLENGSPKKCPICGKSLLYDDYLIARLSEQGNGKNHIRILGCKHCRKRR